MITSDYVFNDSMASFDWKRGDEWLSGREVTSLSSQGGGNLKENLSKRKVVIIVQVSYSFNEITHQQSVIGGV